MDVVSGTSATPQDETKIAEIKAWTKLDHRAQKVIGTAVGPQPMLLIMNSNTSQEMWAKLENVYEQKSKASIHLVQQRFYSFSKDPLDSMATHISKLQTIVQQMKEQGESDSMIVTKILMTLPANFSHFYTAWESTAHADQTLTNLTSRLMMEVARLAYMCPAENVESGALYANKSNRPSQSKKGSPSKIISKVRVFIVKKRDIRKVTALFVVKITVVINSLHEVKLEVKLSLAFV